MKKLIRDKEIRFEFINRNKEFFKKENSIFVNEYGINSSNIVDLASFDFNDNIFYGFEIKSKEDNLKRIKRQLINYITFFNIVYVICHKKHLKELFELLDANSSFDKVGVIEVDDDLNFTEIRKARYYKQFFHLFISNLTREELKGLCESKELDTSGSKRQLIARVKPKCTYSDIYKGINEKLNRLYVKECEVCKSNLYYNKISEGNRNSYCYECGSIILDY